MKLGNYKYVYCEQCGERYTIVPGQPITHDCKAKAMEENNFIIDNETKIIALLSGYVKELSEGKGYEQLTFKLANQLNRMMEKHAKLKVKEFAEFVPYELSGHIEAFNQL